MGLGRKVDRVAKTPIRALPPRRGGRTVGRHALLQPGCKAATDAVPPYHPAPDRAGVALRTFLSTANGLRRFAQRQTHSLIGNFQRGTLADSLTIATRRAGDDFALVQQHRVRLHPGRFELQAFTGGVDIRW